jgi:hypothetical protein
MKHLMLWLLITCHVRLSDADRALRAAHEHIRAVDARIQLSDILDGR